MSNIILSNEDCEYVKSFWDSSSVVIEPNRLTYKIDEINTVSCKVKAKGSYLDISDVSLLNFILKKISTLNVKSILTDSVKIAKYSEGGYFEPHHDFNFYGKGCVYKTLVIQLSDSDTYIGGDLYVKGIPQFRERGSYSLFLSSDIHEVKVVESGDRYSLTVFLYEEDFEHSKSII